MDERHNTGSAPALEESALRGEIERFEAELDGFVRDLRALDRESRQLAEKEQQYEALRKVLSSLDELANLDGLHLFWGEQDAARANAGHLQIANESIESFGRQHTDIEERRQLVLDRIDDQNEVLDRLDYDLRDILEEEELRSNEWVVECEPREIPYRPLVMPWARGTEEDERSRNFVVLAVSVCILLGVALPMVDLPIQKLSELTEVPERVANLIRRERTPPPPPVEEAPAPTPEEEIEPEPLLVEELPSEVTPEAVEQPIVAEVAQPDTREQVKSKGILAFRDSFASRANNRPAAQLGSQARVRDAGQESVGRPERLMVTTSASGSSGGINLADISRDVGGGGQAIEGVQVTRVASTIGGESGADRPLSGGVSAGRTDEEIQIVFDRYKAALYRLYNRELRKDPTLRGQLVLRLTIEPDGSVSFCQLQSTDMEAPTLTQQVVERVSNFDFGAKEGIVAMTIIYPIDFLPAA